MCINKLIYASYMDFNIPTSIKPWTVKNGQTEISLHLSMAVAQSALLTSADCQSLPLLAIPGNY